MNRDQDIKFFKPTNLEENARKPEGRTKNQILRVRGLRDEWKAFGIR